MVGLAFGDGLVRTPFLEPHFVHSAGTLDVGHGPVRTHFLGLILDHVKLCHFGLVPTNWWPCRLLCALWTRRPIVKVTMGCCTEPAAVHIAHVLRRLHFFPFFSFSP